MGVGAWLAMIWCTGSAVTDVRSRRISNRWLMTGAVAVVVWRAMANQAGWDPVWGALLGAGALFVPFWLGGIGAGDMKLMALVGWMCGSRFTLFATLLTGVWGAILALCIRFDIGKARRWLGRPLCQGPLAGPTEEGFVPASGAATIPYAVAITLGVMGTAFWPGGGTP